jgi:putative transposase
MPRARRFLPVGQPVHVTNRGNERRLLFLQPADYEDFIGLMREGLARSAVEVFGYEAMPNHIHIVLAQNEPGAISAYMHRLTCLTACNLRWSTSTAGLGHVFQRRYWSKVIGSGVEFISCLRYVEANAKHGGLVERAEDWEWGSLWERVHPGRKILTPPPVTLPSDWVEFVNELESDEMLVR